MVGVYDGTNATLYMAPVNGTHTQEAQAAASGDGTTGYSSAVSIGDNGAGNSAPFTPDGCATQGQIDDVRIYNTARTPAQLDSDFQTQLAPPVTGLVAYYQLNNSGTTRRPMRTI